MHLKKDCLSAGRRRRTLILEREKGGIVHIDRKWAMPNKYTFKIGPIKRLLQQEVGWGLVVKGIGIDPFAGYYSPAQCTNDLNTKARAVYHMDALQFLKDRQPNEFDWALFDPPYSFSQVKTVYENIGQEMKSEVTKMDYWSKCKDQLKRIVKPGGKVICFGWSTNGMGKSRGFVLDRVLMVPHGGGKNDTLVTVEIKSIRRRVTSLPKRWKG